ncbi:hypothetical protein J2X14_002954 [Pantoea alhagi]|nr:hypothetical protein [Pantoea alhagi]
MIPSRLTCDAHTRCRCCTANAGSTARLSLRVCDFVNELARVNWQFTLAEANAWIENNISTFKDVSINESEARTFLMHNSNNGGMV